AEDGIRDATVTGVQTCALPILESANTGLRFWYAIFDDPISRDNGTSNEEQKAAALSKFGSISRLREPAGYILNIQTPWVPGDLEIGRASCRERVEIEVVVRSLE